jgi:hypothetical protein
MGGRQRIDEDERIDRRTGPDEVLGTDVRVERPGRHEPGLNFRVVPRFSQIEEKATHPQSRERALDAAFPNGLAARRPPPVVAVHIAMM